jgi:hypothetical protein
VKSTFVVTAALALVLLLCACPDQGIICQTGTVRCGQGCIDPTADSRNCGACGSACRSGQICDNSTCKCSAGTTNCDGECVVLDNDPKHCGSCGTSGFPTACGLGLVCSQGICGLDCALGGSSPNLCGSADGGGGGSCVSFQNDANNCGACGTRCENSQSCHAGHCAYDLVAACFSSGQLVGLQQSTEFKGPAESLGTGPAALGLWAQTLLVVDGIDQRLYQAAQQSVGGHAFAKLPVSNKTGNVPNQVVVDPPYAYVANAGSGTVQILKAFETAFPDGGAVGDAGIQLATVAELALGANSYPEGVVKVGTSLWVPLYGGFGAAGAAGGQKVVRIDVASPSNPILVPGDTVDLSAVDLKPFAGKTPVARPYAILSHRGALYVALNNLNADTYLPEGPGLLAKINPSTKAVSIIDLGADKCLNPLWLASDGTHLAVSCGGAAVYNGPPNYELVSTDKAGIVLLDSNDTRTSTWTPGCPAGADGGSGCAPILLGRFTISAGRIYAGDQNGGRLFVLDINGDTLVERRGYTGSAGAPIAACAVDPVTHIGNVADVLAVP